MMGTYDNNYSGNTGAVPGNSGAVPSPQNNSTGTVPLTTGAEKITPLTVNGNSSGRTYTIKPYGTTITSTEVTSPYITIPNYGDEIEKRDKKIEAQEARINELEDKLSKLTSQVLSILDGSKETVDDEIDTERLKRLFEE